YLKERIKEVLTGASASIVVRIHGDDLAVLRDEAQAVAASLDGIEGLVDLHLEPQTLVPRLQITLMSEALERYGVTPIHLRDTLSTLVDGRPAGVIYRGQSVLDLVIRGEESVAQDPLSVGELLVYLPIGGQARLREMVDVRMVAAPNVIKRENGSRRIDVIANARRRDLAAVAGDVEERVQSHAFPRGYHPSVLGEFAAQREARNRLLSLALLSLAAIVVLLYTAFRSLRATLLVVASLPFALVGGVIAVWAGQGVLSLGSFVGFVTVLGVGARNSIMLLDHYRHLELEEGVAFGEALVQQGAAERLPSILMTALTTALALLPIVLRPGAPGTEIEHPMAVVILAGLVSTSLLNLLVLPPLYLVWGRGAAVAVVDED
ncbi:MAG: efflux RND transporter permease subunit, partial [Salinibacterium sp.]|nr:efflux RND transporter permease subunit [Salinibacterium sp.]